MSKLEKFGTGVFFIAMIVLGIAMKLRWFLLAVVIVAFGASYALAGGGMEQQTILVEVTEPESYRWWIIGIVVPIVLGLVNLMQRRRK